MGAMCSSEPPSSSFRREAMLKTFKATLDDWKVTRDEADVLYEAFDGADRTRDGFINQTEFFRMLNLKSTAFTKRIFGLFDDATLTAITPCISRLPSEPTACVSGFDACIREAVPAYAALAMCSSRP